VGGQRLRTDSGGGRGSSRGADHDHGIVPVHVHGHDHGYDHGHDHVNDHVDDPSTA
jgi:hypothetical protein